MKRKAKFTIIFALTVILTVGITACRQTEIVESENSTGNLNQVHDASTATPPPFAWSKISNSYENLKNYTALYEKEEKNISKGEKQTIKLSFRKPFDIRMDWLDDQGKIDQTAIYQKGKNDDKVLAKKSGMLGSLVGTVKLKPTSEIALQDSKHPINEAGLGVLFSRILAETDNSQTKTNYLGEEVLGDGRDVYKIEMSNPTGLNLTGESTARRGLILIDKKLFLQIRIEIYNGNNELLERHNFKNLKLNVNLTDKTFEMGRD